MSWCLLLKVPFQHLFAHVSAPRCCCGSCVIIIIIIIITIIFTILSILSNKTFWSQCPMHLLDLNLRKPKGGYFVQGHQTVS